MKTKAFYFKNELIEKRSLILYSMTIAGLIVFFIKIFYGIYLHNIGFHMLLQSKGIFL